MKNFFAACLVVVTLVFGGCGTNSHVAGNINGNWAATLSSSGADTFAFTTLLTVNADGSLGSNNFTFKVNNTECFPTTTTEKGSFTLTGNFNGQVTGSFQYIITGTEGNILTLNGMVTGGRITGTWTLSGVTACSSGNGNFTMITA